MTMTLRPRRSVLYMPGVNQRAMDKAKTLDCDAVILDLEDAVAPDRKEDARALVCEQVRTGDYGHREVIVRVNGEATPWFLDDMEAAVKAGPDAILVPKVDDAATVGRCQALLGDEPGRPALWVMVETPAAMANVDEIAASGVAVLVMGTSDLVKELRVEAGPERLPLLYALSCTVAAARRYRCDVLDGVCLDLRDNDAFESVCRQGRALGFDGKTLIHPNQVEPANRLLGLDLSEVEHARRVLEAWQGALADGKGVAVLDGNMIENLHAAQAERVVAFADALAARIASSGRSD